MTLAWTCTLLTLAAVAALLWADHEEQTWGRAFWKLAASSGFVATALALGAWQSAYGRWLLAALLLGWVGDALLLSRAAKAFLAGLAAFLLAHLLFLVAFAQSALSRPAMLTASATALAVGAAVLRWLWPHTPSNFRGPVLAYVLVILLMCVVAAGHAASADRWILLAGALLFAASDVSVARDRFVQAARINRLWGWPTYFVAQLLLAWSLVDLP